MAKQQVGLIGLAVMGENLALNFERNGFSLAVYNRTAEKTDAFMAKRVQGKNIKGTYSLEELVNVLERPRLILLMVKAGEAVDKVIDKLKPLLDPDDIIIDGGNSFYEDTARRCQDLESAGLRFIGMGISGGELGALQGSSLMPGGSKAAYEAMEPILTKIAAQVDDGSCVTYLGPKGAGHYVKTVHNGIEYSNMQLVAEAYDLLKHGLGLDHNQLHEVFAEWNNTKELGSYLLEITADIFRHTDPETNGPTLDVISDAAKQGGTGRWTVSSAFELDVCVPTLTAAVNARIMSFHKDQRVGDAKPLTVPLRKYEGDSKVFIDQIRDTLYCSQICAYAQGMALLGIASTALGYDFDLSEIARIWKGGCIIRATFLDEVKHIFKQDPELPNLLRAPELEQKILDRQEAWREVLSVAVKMGISMPASSASIDYFDSYRRDRLPQSLTQAQRDYFGAHRYERTDKPGRFHTEWTTISEESLHASH